MDEKFNEFLFEYDHEGATWCITIMARDDADAKARMQRMSLARYCGQTVVSIPVPFGGFFARLFGGRRG